MRRATPAHRRRDAHTLALEITGARDGVQLAQIGCADAGRMVALASAIRPSGQAIVIVPNETSAARARAAAADAGVPAEVKIAQLTQLPLTSGAFDLVVVDNTDGLFASVRIERRRSFAGEISRILRPGGLAVAICVEARGGIIGAVLERMQSPVTDSDLIHALVLEGFGPIQKRSAPDQLLFVVALKPLT